MTEDIFGIDISAWQGKAGINFDIDEAWDSGMRYVVLKASQGSDYVDRCYQFNYAAFRENQHPWKVGAYHFTDVSNALRQADNFLRVIQNTPLDFCPFQDVEYYSSVALSHNKMYGIDSGNLTGEELYPVLDFRQSGADVRYMLRKPELYGLSITTESIVDVIARKLVNINGWNESGVYTNLGSGNVVFKTARFNWQRIHLWVAHWPAKGQTLTRPLLPNMWKTKDKWIIWQYCVDLGSPHGFPGSLDHDRWGNELPFPGVTPPPVPDEAYMEMFVHETNKVYCGTLKVRC